MLIHINILTKIEDKKKILKAQGKSSLGIPIMLSADFSAETLQARREWHNIFKVMKWKNLQTRIPNKALIQIRWRNQKLYRQVEARRIQHHQTNFATNAKETSLDRKVYSQKRKQRMGKLTGKSKHAVKAGNRLHTKMVSNPATVRRGYKCRILEMHLKLSHQQLKTVLDTCRLLY